MAFEKIDDILAEARTDDQFHVVAGKYDGHEENCKYAAVFRSFSVAMIQWQNVCDYPWARIEWVSPNGVRYNITPIEGA